MICPGVNRPPPIGSELVSGLPEEEGRGVRGAEDEVGLRVADGRGTTIVSPSTLSWSTSVAPVSKSMGFPHEEQNRALAEVRAPHIGQNMETKFYHRPAPRREPERAETGVYRCDSCRLTATRRAFFLCYSQETWRLSF